MSTKQSPPESDEEPSSGFPMDNTEDFDDSDEIIAEMIKADEELLGRELTDEEKKKVEDAIRPITEKEEKQQETYAEKGDKTKVRGEAKAGLSEFPANEKAKPPTKTAALSDVDLKGGKGSGKR